MLKQLVVEVKQEERGGLVQPGGTNLRLGVGSFHCQSSSERRGADSSVHGVGLIEGALLLEQ